MPLTAIALAVPLVLAVVAAASSLSNQSTISREIKPPLVILPSVSVVMPVRNGGNYLAEAVESILGQLGVDLELIIVDDHSNDSAINRLRADPRIRFATSEQRGIVAALNKGLDLARHKYIARMDSDDIAAPERLKTQLEFLLTHPELDIIGAKVELFRDDQTLGQGYRLYQQWINAQCSAKQIADSFFIESCIPHPTALFRRSLLDEIGHYHECQWPEDYDLWCRAFIAGKQFGKPSGPALLRWRDHSSRASRVLTEYTKQAFLKCKATYLAQHLHKIGIRNTVIWGAGPTGLKLHELLQAEQIDVELFIDVNPKLAGQTKRGKPILLVNDNADNNDNFAEMPIILVAVSARGARDKIVSMLNGLGKKVGRDYICVA